MNTIQPFAFYMPTKVHFGPGLAQHLGKLCVEEGYASAFAVLDPGVKASGVLDSVLHNLEVAGIQVTLWSDLQPNPLDSDVERAATAMSAKHHDVVIGIGGGSAQDTAKGVAILAANGGRMRDYAGNSNVPRRAWPFILVPTTAGTGSEVTANASITNVDTLDKMAIRSPNAYAHAAVLDPNLLSGLPARPAAEAAIDALTHAVESYASRRGTDVTRCFAREAIQTIEGSIVRFVRDRGDGEAAANMLYASFLAGIAISHTGTGNAHAISRALGGRYGTTHGLGCGVALPAVMRFNAEDAVRPYVEIAMALGVYDESRTDVDNALAGASHVDGLREQIGIPKKLGLKPDEGTMSQLEEWVVMNAGPNPRNTDRADARRLLQAVM